ncbi:nuclear cap-binding protein subunit 1-like [Grus japonensis]|uniref:Nuclear cap-binding protein subunit 1-like n=1 Tax=Grus japonensis TaxID=30415 RepID=A0ABC9YLC6_GRUJA
MSRRRHSDESDEKLTIYTTLVGLLNARNYNFGGEFVEAMIRQLKECLKVNMYNEAEYLVRFLSDLVNCHVIAAPSMVAMFENFVSVTQEEDIPQYLDCLWAQIQKLKKDRWQERHILRPYLAFDSILCEALQHNLPPFTPPPHTEESVYPMPRVIFRMFDYTDDPEVCVCWGGTECAMGGCKAVLVKMQYHLSQNGYQCDSQQ